MLEAEVQSSTMGEFEDELDTAAKQDLIRSYMRVVSLHLHVHHVQYLTRYSPTVYFISSQKRTFLDFSGWKVPDPQTT